MHRLVAVAVVATGLLLPLPAHASCVPPKPRGITVSTTRVGAGGTVRVSGWDTTDRYDCVDTPLPPPEPAPSSPPPLVDTPVPLPTDLPGPLSPEQPSPDPSPPASAAAPAPARRARAHTPPEPPPPPTVVFLAGKTYGLKEIARVDSNPPVRVRDEVFRHSFAATVTIPAGVAPGEYVLFAHQHEGRIFFGQRTIRVVDGLAATGSHSGALVRLGLLALLSGAAALTAGTRLAPAPARSRRRPAR